MEKESKLKQMEELDARIEKTNYDLAGLENRKKEMEDNKFNKQQEINKLEQEKQVILAKTNNMNRLQKIIYIIVSSKTDLKQVELINTKITETAKEKDNIQNKIDIQNKLYSDTIKEKEGYIEKRRKLYIDKMNENIRIKEEVNTPEIRDLKKIQEIAIQYKNNELMGKVMEVVEQQMKQYEETELQDEDTM